MKRWIKKHARILVVALGVLFIVNATLGLTINKPTGEWSSLIIFHTLAIIIWVIIIIVASGLMEKIVNWWERD